MPTAFDALILDAGLKSSLATVRSLGRHGLRVGALDTGDRVPAFSSRWCRQKFVCEAEIASEAYLAHLERLLEAGIGVLMASHDGTIALLRRHRARLERLTRLGLANETAMNIAVSKERTLAVARELGIAIPRSLIIRTAEELPPALKEIGLPAVIKPTESWLWGAKHGARVGPQLAATVDEAQRAVAKLTELGGTSLVQQIVSGRREAISVLYAHGEIYARFAQWEKRTNPPLGGEGVLRQSIAVPPDIGAQADRLVREIGVEGYSMVEFRRDEADVPHLMEINPRLTASVELAIRCGVNFPFLHYQWASGATIDRVKSYRVGVWLRYLAGDLETTIDVIRQRGRPGAPPAVQAVLNFGRSFLSPTGYDGVDWRDLGPTLKWAAQDAGSFLGRVIAKAPAPFRKHNS